MKYYAFFETTFRRRRYRKTADKLAGSVNIISQLLLESGGSSTRRRWTPVIIGPSRTCPLCLCTLSRLCAVQSLTRAASFTSTYPSTTTLPPDKSPVISTHTPLRRLVADLLNNMSYRVQAVQHLAGVTVGLNAHSGYTLDSLVPMGGARYPFDFLADRTYRTYVTVTYRSSLVRLSSVRLSFVVRRSRMYCN